MVPDTIVPRAIKIYENSSKLTAHMTSERDKACKRFFASTPQNTASAEKIRTIKIDKKIKTTGSCICPVMPDIVRTTPNASNKISKKDNMMATYLLHKNPKILIGYVFKSAYQPDSISPATLILPIVNVNKGNRNNNKLRKLAVCRVNPSVGNAIC